MPDHPELDRALDLKQEGARLRRQAARLASFVAATEEEVADTLEKVAEHRPPADAERLIAMAREAREYAARERDRSADYDRPLLRRPLLRGLCYPASATAARGTLGVSKWPSVRLGARSGVRSRRLR